MKAVVIIALVVWVSAVLAWRYFAAVHAEQEARQRRLDRREASLNVWSSELEQIAGEYRIDRARAQAAAVLLERALGPAPLQTDEVAS